MSFAQHQRNALFSLRLEQGNGRLVLVDRPVGDLLVVDEMRLGLAEIPSRIDLSAGVERFRHQRTRLERLVVHVEDQDLGRMIRGRLDGTVLRNIECRAVDGELVIVGELGHENTPFIARLRIEIAGIGNERSILLSVYEVRVFGPAALAAPQVAAQLFQLLGLEDSTIGPTAAILDPVDGVVAEVCAHLGWKLPARRAIKLSEVQVAAGQLRMVCDLQPMGRVGPRSLEQSLDSSARARRFLAEYEAKSLYANTEKLVEEGQFERAIRHYERQLEIHPDHPFLVCRLLQLLVHRPEGLADAMSLARHRLNRFADDLDALTALANVHWQSDDFELAAECFERIATIADRRGDALEAAQARCAVATVLRNTDPVRALSALEAALALRTRLPGALNALADLQAEAGDWVAALRTRERLLATEDDAETRSKLLLLLGQTALHEAGDPGAAQRFFERALKDAAENSEALIGLAEAQDRAGEFLAAVRTLDRAARILQQRGDTHAAADVIVKLGQLWTREPGEGVETASLRYRQALMLVPNHTGALYGLSEVAMLDGDVARARNALEELLRASDAGRVTIDRQELFLRLGRVLAQEGGDTPMAIAYFQKALDGDGAFASEALAALEDIYTVAGRWDDVARVLEMAAHRAETPEQVAACLARLAEVVSSHHGDPDRAIELLEQATAQQAAPELLKTLVVLYRQAENRPSLASALGRLAERETQPEVLAQLYTEQADLLRVHLNESDRAIDAYGKALGCLPDHLDALTGLSDVYRERERFGELATLLERQVALVESAETVELLLELAAIEADELQRVDSALAHLELADDQDPEHTGVLRRIAQLHAEADRLDLALVRYEQLRALYERDGYEEPVAPFLGRMADTLEGLGRLDEALDCLRGSLDSDPDRIETYKRAQDMLLRSGSIPDVVSFLEAGLERAVTPTGRLYLAKRIGRLLWRELRRPEDAVVALDEASRYDPDDTDVQRMRLEVATALADWPRVSSLLQTQLEAATEAEKPALLVSLAKLAYQELGRPDEGEQFVNAALSEQGDYIPALTLLGEQSFADERWEQARRAFAALEELEGVHARPDDRYRLAVAILQTGEADEAFERLRMLRAEGVYFAGLSLAFAEACFQSQRKDALYSALKGMDDVPASERLDIVRRSARLMSTADDYREQAIELWQQVQSLAPGDDEANEALDRLVEEVAPEATLRATDAEIETDDGMRRDPAESTEVTAATQILPEVDDASAEEMDTSAGEQDTSEQEKADERAVPDPGAPEPDASELGRTGEQVSVDPDAGEETPEVSQQPPAEIFETAEMGSLAGPLSAADRAELEATFDPDDDELPPLATRTLPSQAEIDEPEEAAAQLVAAIEASDDVETQAGLSLQLAELTRDRLHDPEGAIPHFRSALDLAHPGNETWEESIEALEDLHALRSEWDDLLALYDRRIESGLSDVPTMELLKASVLRTCRRFDEARDAAEKAQSLGERALELLVAILEDQGESLLAAERLLADMDDLSRTDKGHRSWRAAELMRATDPERALELMTEARDILGDPLLVDQCIVLARECGHSEALVTSLEARADQLEDEGAEGVRRSGILVEAAGIAMRIGHDLNHVRRLLEDSLVAWPDNVDATTMLSEVLETQGDDGSLIEILERQLNMLLPGPHRAELASRILHLAENVPDVLIDTGRLTSIVAEERSDDPDSVRPPAAPPPDVVSSLVAQAKILADTPGAMQEAVSMLEEALGVDPRHTGAYQTLALLYADADMVPELCGVLERQAAVIGAVPERAELLLRRGLIARDELGDADGAAAAFERIIEDDAASSEATRQALHALTTLRSHRVDFERIRILLEKRVESARGTEAETALVTLVELMHRSVEDV